MIKIENLSKIYKHQDHETLALDNINLSIEAGSIFGIIGKSGSGKSSLIRCINLLEKPTQGTITLDGKTLSGLTAHQLKKQRQQVGMVFQQFNLLESRTVFDNIALPLEFTGVKKDIINQKIIKLLELIGLSEKKQHYPNQLSGGQKQRVAIARALITHPKILLCDEATSALDPESTQAILELLKKINRELGITILIITHEMDVVKAICQKVAILHNGQLVEQGTLLDIFSNPQQEITKRLTSNSLHLELPANITQRLKKLPVPGLYPIVRLTFVGQQANQAIVSTLHEHFQVAVNILLANLELIGEVSIGFMFCQLHGELDQIRQSIDFLRQQKIKVELIGYG